MSRDDRIILHPAVGMTDGSPFWDSVLGSRAGTNTPESPRIADNLFTRLGFR